MPMLTKLAEERLRDKHTTAIRLADPRSTAAHMPQSYMRRLRHHRRGLVAFAGYAGIMPKTAATGAECSNTRLYLGSLWLV
jgi:hypothetical protein